ncbi:ATP-grasp domain-containing protein [uncultured Maricaulis sp.]|uniref:ATP-grasp domain-containing protein n=1 Tax=uncultured Maricaulis sp. TaxID=174710 RepID=UPI0030DAA160|tara:strand:- start:108088 stop:109371 length:1284 start_codon:yes stop_codon:yes gene_type:complete
MPKPVIIITYARSLMALTVGQSLRPIAGKLIGVDSVEWTVLGFSRLCDEHRHLPDPGSRPQDYVEALVALSEEFLDQGPVLIMPVFEDAPLLARNRDKFPKGVTIAASPAAAMDQVYPKDKLARSVAEWGVPAPATDVVETPLKGKAGTFKNKPPLIIKPAEGNGGRGVLRVETTAELEHELAKRSGTQLLQALVPGKDYCVTAMADGKTVFALSAYLNLEQYPPHNGAGALRETVLADAFRPSMQRIVEASGWTGTLQADFRWSGDEADTPMLIEINARLWAGITHSVHSGVDYPLLLAKQALGDTLPEPGKPQIGFRSKLPFLWLAGLTGSSLDEAEYLGQIEESWNQLAQSDITLGDRITGLWRDMTDFETLRDDINAALERSKRAEGAKADIGVDEAGSAALGSLFILSHLLRHGRLPAEVKK